jgi:hypothetical protein
VRAPSGALDAGTDARPRGIGTESPDAGDLVPTAQVTAGVGPLPQIQGFLASPTDVDVFR